MADKEKPSVEEQLKNIFLKHSETHAIGEKKFLGYTKFRKWKYGIKSKNETVEISEHINGSLVMKLVEITCDMTDAVLKGLVTITDAEHGLSESKYITEVDYLKKVLSILDEEKKEKS